MKIINCDLLYKCRQCNENIIEKRSHIRSPSFPGTIKLDDYFEYKVIKHFCSYNIMGFADIVGYKIKENI